MARKPKATPAAEVLAPVVDIPPAETVAVGSHRIACDGVGGALGHPRVWLELGGAGSVDCPYCDRRFVAADHGQSAPGVYEDAAGH